MFNKKMVLIAVMLVCMTCGCNSKKESKHIDVPKDVEEAVEVITEENNEEMFTDSDYEEGYDAKKCVNVKFNNNKITTDKDAVRIKDNKAIIDEEGTYVLSGKLNDGMIVIDADKKDKIQLVLKNADITSKNSAPIYVKEADKVVLTLEKKSKNKLINGGKFEKIDKNNIDGVIFSKSDITINGQGSMNISTESGHGIVSKDDLVVTNGNINIKAGNHSISGKDSVRIGGGNLNLESGKDGIHADNEQKGHIYIGKGKLRISAKDDGIHASNNIVLNEGTIDIIQSYEGIEGKCIDIIAGNINIVSSDDGINVAGGKDKSGVKGPYMGEKDRFLKDDDCYLNISGGKIQVDAEGDGIDSNGSVLVSGGETYVSGPTKGGNGALDYETSAQSNGGIFVSTGVAGMVSNFDENSAQGTIMLEFKGKEKDKIEVLDEKNNSIFKWEAKKQFQNIIISHPKILQGKEYIVKVGSNKKIITMNKIVYSSNNMNGHRGGLGDKFEGRPGERFDDKHLEEDKRDSIGERSDMENPDRGKPMYMEPPQQEGRK
jgi:hypothetical protein